MNEPPDNTQTPQPSKGLKDRDARLKAALKANMARRKAQARSRDGATGCGASDHGNPDPGTDGQQQD